MLKRKCFRFGRYIRTLCFRLRRAGSSLVRVGTKLKNSCFFCLSIRKTPSTSLNIFSYSIFVYGNFSHKRYENLAFRKTRSDKILRKPNIVFPVKSDLFKKNIRCVTLYGLKQVTYQSEKYFYKVK